MIEESLSGMETPERLELELRDGTPVIVRPLISEDRAELAEHAQGAPDGWRLLAVCRVGGDPGEPVVHGDQVTEACGKVRRHSPTVHSLAIYVHSPAMDIRPAPPTSPCRIQEFSPFLGCFGCFPTEFMLNS